MQQTNKQQQKRRKNLKSAILREEINSKIVEQSDKPQHLDQSNKVFWHRACN